MKKIMHIARNELYTLFYSPIAWVLMIIFIVLSCTDFLSLLKERVGYFQRGELLFVGTRLTNSFLTHPSKGLILSVAKSLYIFLPLVTMGLISRETSSGTIKLLYSSPVKIREIVLGKYLAILAFTSCLVALVAVILAGFSISITSPDYGHMAAALFGLFMILATYAAIGLFISSLTNYLIVAAVITLGILALLTKIGGMWQEYPAVRNITYYLNIGEKAYNFRSGLLNLRDFSYFLILITCFLTFTVIRIRSATESISVFRKTMRYVSIILIAVLAAWITSRPVINFYWDTTRNDSRTISPAMQQLLAKLDDGELKVTVVGNLLNLPFAYFEPKEQNSIITDHWEKYIRFKHDININFVYYYANDTNSYYFKANPGRSAKEIAIKEAATYRMDLKEFLPPEEISKLVDVKAENYRHLFLLSYKGKTTILRTFDDFVFWPSDNEVSAALTRLVDTTPKILFLADEIERGPFSGNPRNYKRQFTDLGNRVALVSQGYDIDTLSLHNNDIPRDIAALVIADPRTPFLPESLDKINRYIDGGGNLYITSEPDRADVVNPLLDKLGIQLRPGRILQSGETFGSDCVFAIVTDSAKNIHPWFKWQLATDVRYYYDTVHRVAMTGVSALDYREKDGFHADPLLVTNPKLSWNRVTPVNPDSLSLNIPPAPGDEHGSFVTALRLTRMLNGKQQRIVVAGDADYITRAAGRGAKPKRYNAEMSFWSFTIFSYGKYPGTFIWPEAPDNRFTITLADIPTYKLMYYWIIPAIIAIVSTIFLVRRKRK